MREPAVPYLEPILGALWWTVGTAALNRGPGTVVLAAGLGATAGLVVALRRRHGRGAPLPPGGRGRLLRLIGVTVALVAAIGTGLGYFYLSELAVPVACALVGAALVPLASLLEHRSLLAAAGALMVLGAVGAVVALESVGPFYPQGVVGMVAGAVLWLVAAHRGGLFAELRARR